MNYWPTLSHIHQPYTEPCVAVGLEYYLKILFIIKFYLSWIHYYPSNILIRETPNLWFLGLILFYIVFLTYNFCLLVSMLYNVKNCIIFINEIVMFIKCCIVSSFNCVSAGTSGPMEPMASAWPLNGPPSLNSKERTKETNKSQKL